MQFAQHRAGVKRNEAGLLLGAVDHGGHLALTPGRSRRPLTGSRACLGLDSHDIGHGPLLQMATPASRGAGVAGDLAGMAAWSKPAAAPSRQCRRCAGDTRGCLNDGSRAEAEAAQPGLVRAGEEVLTEKDEKAECHSSALIMVIEA